MVRLSGNSGSARQYHWLSGLKLELLAYLIKVRSVI
jgi:hypothetical protein